MKVALILASLVAGGSAFGILPQTTKSTSATTALKLMIPEEEMTADQLKIKEITEKWREVRHLSREEAEEQLDGEWLEAYNRFYEKYDEDMSLMLEIKEKVAKMIEPPKVEKKGLKQRKRDKWAKVQARQAAAAAAAK